MTAKVLKGVKLGKNVELGDFVIIGVCPKGISEGELETVIGDHAVIRSHTVIYAGNKIGENFQTGHHVLIRESNVIGSNVSIGTGSIVEHHVTIQDGVRVHTQAFIPEFTTLETEAWIGPRVVLTNAVYPRSQNVKEQLAGPVIGKRAKVGANATVLPGVKLGENCLVGAGAVVTKDVERNAVVVGNPAVKINSIEHLPYE